MKSLILIFAFFFTANHVFPQSSINKSIEVKKGQGVHVSIDDAQLINVRSWNENYMEITASIQINNGKNNDSYTMEVYEKAGRVHVDGIIRNKDKLPKMIQMKKGDQVYSFNTDDSKSPEIMKFYEEYGREGILWTSHGVMWEINYEIKIPSSVELNINSKFAMIDIENYEGNVQANSKHGGVDYALDSNKKMDFNLKSDWGEIFTNLDLNFNTGHKRDEREVTCSLNGGGGPLAILESKHGNIYLRDAK